jgi:hypothetical protein
MALWGNDDAVTSAGTVSLNYTTGVVTGSGSDFVSTTVGQVIRFGTGGAGDATYFGDAVVVSVASTTSCTIGSTMGLSGAAISGVQYQLSELPKSSVLNVVYSESASGTPDSYVYGSAAAGIDATDMGVHAGWVGVTTYVDNHGNLRTKTETLVAASGITTGNVPAFPPEL